MPIKHSIGDYFIVDLDGKMFAFTLKNARILIHRRTLTKSFRVIQYDTCHYSSLKPETKDLELLLQKNALPKINRLLHNILRVLARREKEDFHAHDIKKLVDEFAKHGDDNPKYLEEVKNIKKFLEELDVEKIVTPVRKITDFLTEDFIATSPSFLGELLPRYQRLDTEHKKITNTPIKSTSGIMKIIVIALMAVIIVVGLVYAIDQGVFDGVADFIENIGTLGEGFSGIPSPLQGIQTKGVQDYSDDVIMTKYSGCETLKPAINSGEIDYNKLSANMKSLIDSCPDE